MKLGFQLQGIPLEQGDALGEGFTDRRKPGARVFGKRSRAWTGMDGAMAKRWRTHFQGFLNSRENFLLFRHTPNQGLLSPALSFKCVVIQRHRTLVAQS